MADLLSSTTPTKPDLLSSTTPTEPDLIQQQCDILRAFRAAGQQRAGAEANSNAKRKAELDTADAAVDKIRQDIAEQCAIARGALAIVQTGLAQVGVTPIVNEQQPASLSNHSVVDPAGELVRCASLAKQGAKILIDHLYSDLWSV